MGKMETLTPCKIETLEQIDTQFVRMHSFMYCHVATATSLNKRRLITGQADSQWY